MPRPPDNSYLCYMLFSAVAPEIYVGSTNNMKRRLHEHNFTKKGAKETHLYRPWTIAALVEGFTNHMDALQFEWAWQHPHRTKFLKAHRAQHLIDESPLRTFSNWYRAGFYLSHCPHWKNKSIKMSAFSMPPFSDHLKNLQVLPSDEGEKDLLCS